MSLLHLSKSIGEYVFPGDYQSIHAVDTETFEAEDITTPFESHEPEPEVVVDELAFFSLGLATDSDEPPDELARFGLTSVRD